jgi:hypothetical protein
MISRKNWIDLEKVTSGSDLTKGQICPSNNAETKILVRQVWLSNGKRPRFFPGATVSLL